ncbi:MAG TPA: alpha/beta hydrolase domain-containing protein [Acidimicrobiales bacterium]
MTTSALVPEVVGPVQGPNPPWGGPTHDVTSDGYVVEEFYLGGTTTAYDLAPGADYTEDGRWAAAAGDTRPYLTRILVVRPREPAAFNGTVVLNWQNVSAGYEYGGLEPGDEALEGYAWVGVSAQEVGIFGFSGRRAMGGGRPLQVQDPERYGVLRHPGDPGSFEIFAQAARAVGPARTGDVDPLGGLEVQRVIAAGGSQSAMRLVAYANAVHPLDPVVDGFLLTVSEGKAPRLMAGGEDFYYARTTLRADLATPTVIVNSELEALSVAGLEIDDHETRRIWEVAGTAHGVWPGPATPDSRGVIPNPLSYQPVAQAALRQLHRWLSAGTPAPHQPRIQSIVEPRANLVRDSFGNAVGGVRLPDLAVPTHEHRGYAVGTGYPPMFGASQPFTPDELRGLYPSREVFVQRWTDAVDDLVATGALRPEDAGAMKARAESEAARLPTPDG